jgi:hypothetical protein
MTITPSDLFDLARGWVYRRRWNAMRVYNLLRTYRLVDRLQYDSSRATVTAKRYSCFGSRQVELVFTRNSARITFPDRFGTGLLSITVAASPALGAAIAEMAVGLLVTGAELHPEWSELDSRAPFASEFTPADEFELSNTDQGRPHCCGQPMAQVTPEIWYAPDPAPQDGWVCLVCCQEKPPTAIHRAGV